MIKWNKARVWDWRTPKESKCKHCDKDTVYYVEVYWNWVFGGRANDDITTEDEERFTEATGFYCEDHITPDMYEVINNWDRGEALLDALGYKELTLEEKINSLAPPADNQVVIKKAECSFCIDGYQIFGNQKIKEFRLETMEPSRGSINLCPMCSGVLKGTIEQMSFTDFANLPNVKEEGQND